MRAVAFLWVVAALLLAGCVSDGRRLPAGADAAAVRADMGNPQAVAKLADGGEVWFYPRGRVARQTFRADIGPDGRLRGIDQVLDEHYFDEVIAYKTTREQLFGLIGPPQYAARGSLSKQDIWEYHYFWGAQHPYLVRFGIDDNGIVTGQVRMSEDNGPASRM